MLGRGARAIRVCLASPPPSVPPSHSPSLVESSCRLSPQQQQGKRMSLFNTRRSCWIRWYSLPCAKNRHVRQQERCHCAKPVCGTSLSSAAGLALSSRHVVVDNHLPVLRRANLRPGGVVPRGGFRVHVHDLPVSLVLEQQTRFAVGDDLLGMLYDFVVHSV